MIIIAIIVVVLEEADVTIECEPDRDSTDSKAEAATWTEKQVCNKGVACSALM